MKRILICWIGNTDLQASEGEDVGVGPIAQALEKREFDEVFFITDYEATRVKPYINWIKKERQHHTNYFIDIFQAPPTLEKFTRLPQVSARKLWINMVIKQN